MSGSFHHGSSGFPEPSSPSSNPPSSNVSAVRAHLLASYAERGSDIPEPSLSQRSSNFYTHPSRISILNPSGDLALGGSSGYGNFSDMENINMNMDNPSVAGVADGARTSRDRERRLMPSFSRAFYTLFTPEGSDKAAHKDNHSGFFIPSYLEGSTYVRKLEEAHRSKLQARESNRTSANGLAPNLTTFKPQQSTLPPGSHRGMSHTVVERPPPFEHEDTLNPLPTRWNKDDQWGGIEITSDGLSVKYMTPRAQYEREQQEACAVRADHYMPPQCGIYYFEVQIVSAKQGDATIGIGFSTKTATLSRPVGWEPEAWGYHGDDGRIFTGTNNGKAYAPQYNTNDVIGCGVNFRDKTAFFTRNGVHLGTAFHDVVKDKLYPSVSLKKGGETIRANFGQTAFVYNIDDMMKEERARIEKDIQNCDITKLAPGLNETELLQSLVLQFLQHDGYVEAARAFAGEIQDQKEALNLDANVKIDGINIKDDEDANNRQRIRKAILEGDIDRALKYTNAYYPRVLQNNEQVFFRLRCRRFIEMVRRAAHLRTNGQSKKTNGHMSDAASQAMDVDLNGSDSNAWAGSIDADGGEMSPELLELEISMLSYGQNLQAEYANDPRKEFSKALMDIWALVAYPNPLKEPQVSHLLDKQGRVAVAEELNSAILLSLGKSSRASLETLYAQTVVLLEDLRQDGGEGAFVSIDHVMEGVPRPTPL